MFSQQIMRELEIINSLLRSKEYTYEMAKALNAGNNVEQKNFINAGEAEDVARSVRDEKIAISIAAFYALECGIGFLCEQRGLTPVDWLEKITSKTADPGTMLLLNRFANATWKAGQPFRSLGRITRYNFTGASYLAEEEIKKDRDQVTTAAVMLLQHMYLVRDKPLPDQMNQVKALLRDIVFTSQMAEHLNLSYHADQHLPVPLFLTPADETNMIYKNGTEQKIATSIAGFYALECGVSYLVTTKALVPTAILKSIIDGSIEQADKTLFLRLANATWKAGQPFRGIERITRDIFCPAYYLTEEDVEKDMRQVKSAARKLLETIEATDKKANRN